MQPKGRTTNVLKTRIIPCLDVKDGRVVKGVNFVDLIDAGDPVEAAAAYDAAGADELCFLDITASHEERDTIFHIVEQTAERCFMPLTVGGGVRTIADIGRLLNAGADKVSINTAAVKNREFVKDASEKFGNQCIVVAIDAKKVSKPGEPNKWEIFTHGGRTPTGIDAIEYAKAWARLIILSRASLRAVRAQCLLLRSFTSVRIRSRKPKSTWQPRALRFDLPPRARSFLMESLVKPGRSPTDE